MNSIEQAIIKTIAYFDIFDYPLTVWELYLFLYTKDGVDVSLSEIEHTLEQSDVIKQRLFNKDGLVGFKGKEYLAEKRQQRFITSHHKYHRVKRFVRFARHIPYVEIIASCNNLGFLNAKKNSDLDFFIVTQKGALPLVRLLTVLLSIVFFKRPSKHKVKDTICLSFFVDTDRQRLSKLALENGDIYLMYWYATLQPMYLKTIEKYQNLEAENSALLAPLAHHLSRESVVLTLNGASVLQKISEKIIDLLPRKRFQEALYQFQLKKLPKGEHESLPSPTSVQIGRSIFKRHLDDKRISIHEQWIHNSN